MPAQNGAVRSLPARMEDRLIVALDLPTVAEARAIVARLEGTVSFFKLGLWLIFAPGFEAFLDDLLAKGRNVFPVLWRKGSTKQPTGEAAFPLVRGAMLRRCAGVCS